jgi:peptidoglycan/xylan/chitin deacetylase (PgdA/CDA1 family)
VAIAAHGYSHRRLDQPGVDLQAEIDVPQTLLTARLGRPVDSFVFPYGRYSVPALQRAIEVYRYVFCNGNAANESWDGRLFRRIDAGGMESPGALFKPVRMAGYQIRAFWNRLGGQPDRRSGGGARGGLATAALHS